MRHAVPSAGNLLGVKGGGEEGSVGGGAQQDPHAGHQVLHGVQLSCAPHHLCQHRQACAVQCLRLHHHSGTLHAFTKRFCMCYFTQVLCRGASTTCLIPWSCCHEYAVWPPQHVSWLVHICLVHTWVTHVRCIPCVKQVWCIHFTHRSGVYLVQNISGVYLVYSIQYLV